jgi:hypothetical protein
MEENGKVSLNHFPSFGVKCELLGCGHLSVGSIGLAYVDYPLSIWFDGYHLENEISIANILDVQYITDLWPFLFILSILASFILPQ